MKQIAGQSLTLSAIGARGANPYRCTSRTEYRHSQYALYSSSEINGGVAIFAVFALIMTQSGQVVVKASIARQNTNNYSAGFTIPSSAATGKCIAQVHSVDVAGKTTVGVSNSFIMTSYAKDQNPRTAHDRINLGIHVTLSGLTRQAKLAQAGGAESFLVVLLAILAPSTSQSRPPPGRA